MKRLLREKEVAEIYGISVRTLQKWRCTGGGPPFVKANRSIRYRMEEIESYLDLNTHSTTSSYSSSASGGKNE